jgi:hypothetical protein
VSRKEPWTKEAVILNVVKDPCILSLPVLLARAQPDLEKIVQRCGVFFGDEKHDVSTPSLSRISPRSHHQNTTTKRPSFPKHP